MEAAEVFSMLGFPARLAGRFPLWARYIWGMHSNILAPSTYALQRFGPSYRFRPWLILDASQLEPIEHMINNGTDSEILAFRNAHVASNAGTAVVGSLLASACATVLTLPSLSLVNVVVRGTFTVSLMLSLLAVYFTLVQQKSLMSLSAATLCLWLWNGRMRTVGARHGVPTEEAPVESRRHLRRVRESSVTSSIILEAPLELLSIAIALFITGLIVYLALGIKEHVQIGTGPEWGNTAVLIAFLTATTFPLVMFGQALGQKDTEMARCIRSEEADVVECTTSDMRREKFEM